MDKVGQASGRTMSHETLKRQILIGSVALIFVTTISAEARADFISAVFDLFDPLPGSVIFVPALGRLVPVLGVPITSFPEFGGADLGNTDSILHRDNAVSDSGPFVTPVEMQAMQFVSTDGSDVFFTLQSTPASVGTLNVTFGPLPNSGTFTGTLMFSLTLRAVLGPGVHIIRCRPGSWSLTLEQCCSAGDCLHFRSQLPAKWHRQLDGLLSDRELYGERTERHIDRLRNSGNTEPGTVILVSSGLAALAFRRRRQRSGSFSP
jgi:hypothetical protein